MFQRCSLVCLFLLSLLGIGVAERELDPSKPKGSDPLFPIHYDGKWGFMVREGTVVLPPKFEAVGGFFYRLARASVKHNGKWKDGYVDTTGAFVIEPIFDKSGDFLDDLAPVRVEKEWGFIDRKGRFVVPPSFQAAGEFHEGLARVMFCPNETIPLSEFPLLEDTFRLEVESGSKFTGRSVRFGFIDKAGKIVIELQDWEMADDFSEGLAYVRGRDLKCRYINQQGQFAFSRSFDHAKAFSEDLASVMVQGKCGYIDKRGEFAIPTKFDYCGSFSEGLAVVAIASENPKDSTLMRGAINKKGEFVVPPVFREITDFSEGLAAARKDRQWSFIDKIGNAIRVTDLPIEPWGFHDGLAIVGYKGKRVYIDKTGRVVAPFEKNLK